MKNVEDVSKNVDKKVIQLKTLGYVHNGMTLLFVKPTLVITDQVFSWLPVRISNEGRFYLLFQ